MRFADSHRRAPRTLAGAFTLVELLIVVAILAILAGVAIPQFTSSVEDGKESALQANLTTLRKALELYRYQHRNEYPGYPPAGGNPTAAEFVDQLTLASKPDGTTAAPGTAGFDLGPYIADSIPVNPFNGLRSVTVLLDADAFPVAADGLTGWVYKPGIGRIQANSGGVAPSGPALFGL